VYSKYKVSFEISDIPKIGKGKTSVPIKVYTPRSPHTDVKITVSLQNTELTGITISPTELNFTPGRNQRYFEVSVDGDFNTLTNSST